MDPLRVFSLLVTLSATLALGQDETPRPPTKEVDAWLELDASARRAWVEATPREALAQTLGQLDTSRLIAIGRRSVAQLGTYRARLTKVERVDGELLEPQVMRMEIRETPFALRAEVLEGPGKGRRLLYNEELRAKDLRVREAGFLGIAGAVWVGIDSGLTRGDTNHRISDLGYGPLLGLLERDFEKAKGQHSREDEGFAKDGAWCMRYTAPPGVKGLYADQARVCFDARLGLVSRVEVFRKGELFERHDYQLLASRLSLGDGAFTPEGAGL